MNTRRRGTLVRLFGYFARQRLRLGFAMVMLIAGSVIMSFQPVVFGAAVDDLAAGVDGSETDRGEHDRQRDDPDRPTPLERRGEPDAGHTEHRDDPERRRDRRDLEQRATDLAEREVGQGDAAPRPAPAERGGERERSDEADLATPAARRCRSEHERVERGEDRDEQQRRRVERPHPAQRDHVVDDEGCRDDGEALAVAPAPELQDEEREPDRGGRPQPDRRGGQCQAQAGSEDPERGAEPRHAAVGSTSPTASGSSSRWTT